VIDGDGRDGDVSLLPDVLEGAREIGILASPDPGDDGHEYGVWGTASVGDDVSGSLTMLEEIAAVCAGVACCVHAIGLGVSELRGAGLDAQRVGVGLEDGGWPIDLLSVDRPWPGCAGLSEDESTLSLSGCKDLLWQPPGCDGFVIYAAGSGGWERVFLPRGASGLIIVDHILRTGLAAAETVGLRFDDVPISDHHRLPERSPAGLLERQLLGVAAIAVGNARGALDAARQYTAERYQGGAQIESHPAVRILLGEAASRIEAAAAIVRSAGAETNTGRSGVLRAAAAKLRATVDCCDAVTDCLQTLGGYGYMEEFRLEKRLRDALTLKTTTPRPDDVRQALAVMTGRGA
jgi:alkylation response protein AidB-like acyl-CoA dehydrogenase